LHLKPSRQSSHPYQCGVFFSSFILWVLLIHWSLLLFVSCPLSRSFPSLLVPSRPFSSRPVHRRYNRIRGMSQPDHVKGFTVGGVQYYVSANEGMYISFYMTHICI
jgi:hypothetical protein